jgi:hypothetical protein
MTTLSRRDALVGAGLIAALPWTHRWPRKRITVLFDPKIEESNRFARALRGDAVNTEALGADPIAQAHDGALAAALRDRSPLAGLTTWSDYFMIRDVAREYRFTPRFESHHHLSRDGALHVLPEGVAMATNELDLQQWPERVARLLRDDGPDARRIATRCGGGVTSSRSYFAWLLA